MAIEQVAREHGWRTYIINTFSNDPSANILESLSLCDLRALFLQRWGIGW